MRAEKISLNLVTRKSLMTFESPEQSNYQIAEDEGVHGT